jgi:hypothetical protein
MRTDPVLPIVMKNGIHEPFAHGRGWQWFRLLLTGLVLCRGCVLLCVMPPFEGWDEYQHVGYMVYLAQTGHAPILGQTDVPVSLLARLNEFPQSGNALKQLGGWGAVDYATYWSRMGPGETPTAATLTEARVPLYQAQHGPLYYRLASPLFTVLGGVSDLRTAIGGLRLANLVLTAASVWIALGIVRRVVRDGRMAAFCGLLIATQPLFLINGVRVANDALGVFVATAAVALAMSLTRRHLTFFTFGLGMVVGLAVLAKTVNLGLLPFIGACSLTALFRDRPDVGTRVTTGTFLAVALSLVLGFLTTTQSEFRANWERFNSPTVMQESVANRAAGRGTADLIRAARSIAWSQWTRKLWLRESVMSGGWSWVGTNERLRRRYEILVGIALLGSAWIIVPAQRHRILRLYRDPLCTFLCLALCFGYTCALGNLSYAGDSSQPTHGTPRRPIPGSCC